MEQSYSDIRALIGGGRAKPLLDVLDALTSAVFCTHASGRLTFANQAGEELVRQRLWVQVVNGTLAPARNTTEARFFAGALRRLPAGSPFKLLITDNVSGTKAIVRGALISLSAQSPSLRESTMLVWLSPVVPNAETAADIATMFGLTAAETRLIARLIAGDDLRDAAAHLRISTNTARTQLKSVFGKTGQRTQTSLLVFAARLSAVRSQPSAASPVGDKRSARASSYDPPEPLPVQLTAV